MSIAKNNRFVLRQSNKSYSFQRHKRRTCNSYVTFDEGEQEIRLCTANLCRVQWVRDSQ